ncbi:MAG TPA: N-acetyl-gamma-glutamyl-phosphate reductase [Gemmatimonadales bacterium]|nr:N-acetyl-gamma-glutamyl-phosphate reductase [Gemmatimonadales bacterium]
MTATPFRAALVGGSGYVGGELIRLLLGHPGVALTQVASASQAGRLVHWIHPNLRGVSDLKFVAPDQLEPADVLFLAQRHGEAAGTMERWAGFAQRVVDTSADFRLRSAAEYRQWYGEEHPAPGWLERFVYGLPERRRQALGSTAHASGVGCNATVTILAIAPLVDAGLVERVVADVKVGSSEAGSAPSAASHHPERSGAVRSFMPTGHRHQAEIRQELGGGFELAFSVTGVELVRGALVTAHCFLRQPMEERELWRLYREAYGREPFIRLVASKSGIHRFPEPKLLAGTNWCDIGFAVDQERESRRVVVMAAIDNLMKGAAGSAVQCMNLMCGMDETAGLRFPGLHPI